MKTRINLNLPNLKLNQQQMLVTGLDMVALIKARTYKGVDADDKPFDGYSTNPIYISKNSQTAKRLAPKGGEKTKSGGMYFEGGYREYKEKSRKRTNSMEGQTSEVDLTLSGQLMQNFTVLQSSSQGFTIGLLEPVQQYGYFVNDRRKFIGLTDEEVQKLIKMIEINLLGDSNE
jgi:hypothetical protein